MLTAGCLAGLLALAATSPSSTQTQSETLILDGARSSAAFSVKVLWMFVVDGQFGNVRGTVNVDRLQGQATVNAQIETAAVTMNRTSAISWIKSAEFFDVERYPEIRFRSDPFPISRLHQGGELPGALTLRGITRAVVFEVEPATCARVAIDCPVEAAGIVRRSDFGMATRRATLSDKVELRFTIRMTEAASDAAES